MAGGGKQNPRQRMINMMYLVLTALLALQVSNDVLNKFTFIDDALQHSIEVSETANAELVDGIEKQVEKNGNTPEDNKVLSNAKRARELAAEAAKEIDKVREIIYSVSGYDPETGEIEDKKSYDAQMAKTIGEGGAKNGAGYELEKALNDYVAAMRKLTEDSIEIEKIAKDGKELYEGKDEEQAKKDFAQVTFDHTPNVAALAVLSQLESEVVRIETEVVEFFAKKVGATKIKFDSVIAMVRPKSRIIPAGTEYEAELFITATSKGFTPEMSFRGNRIDVDPDSKMGLIKFRTASENNYDEKTNLAEKTYKASIKIPDPRGGMQELEVEETYYVAKPVVQVKSASVQALYLNCGNDLNVTIPAFGAEYNPNFSTTTGQVIPGSEKGNVIVVPDPQRVLANDRKANLTVTSTGYTETLEFSVRKIPDPQVDVFLPNGQPANPKEGFSCNGAVQAKAVPDKDFASFLPKDARYRVMKVEIILKRGTKAILTRNLSSGRINLNDVCQSFRPGDQLVVTIEEVQRMNFQGKTEVVNLPQKIAIYPLLQ